MNKIKCLSTNAARAFLDELLPVFEREHDCQVTVVNNTTQQILAHLRDSTVTDADVLIATVPGVEELKKLGKIIESSSAILGSTKVGIGVRAGIKHPDISSVEACKRALLAAPLIAYTTQGQSGIHFERMVTRLGMFEQLKPQFNKIAGGLVGEIVVRGEAEMGVQMLSEILAVPGFELVGPFPPELNEVTTFAAALLTGTRQTESATAFVRFLTTAQTRSVMRAKGFETPISQ